MMHKEQQPLHKQIGSGVASSTLLETPTKEDPRSFRRRAPPNGLPPKIETNVSGKPSFRSQENKPYQTIGQISSRSLASSGQILLEGQNSQQKFNSSAEDIETLGTGPFFIEEAPLSDGKLRIEKPPTNLPRYGSFHSQSSMSSGSSANSSGSFSQSPLPSPPPRYLNETNESRIPSNSSQNIQNKISVDKNITTFKTPQNIKKTWGDDVSSSSSNEYRIRKEMWEQRQKQRKELLRMDDNAIHSKGRVSSSRNPGMKHFYSDGDISVLDDDFLQRTPHSSDIEAGNDEDDDDDIILEPFQLKEDEVDIVQSGILKEEDFDLNGKPPVNSKDQIMRHLSSLREMIGEQVNRAETDSVSIGGGTNAINMTLRRDSSMSLISDDMGSRVSNEEPTSAFPYLGLSSPPPLHSSQQNYPTNGSPLSPWAPHRSGGDLSSSEIAAKALSKRATETAVAFKEYAHELEAKLDIADTNISQMIEKIQMLEIQRLLLATLLALVSLIGILAILFHFPNIFDHHFTWFLLFFGIACLYILLFFSIRRLEDFRSSPPISKKNSKPSSKNSSSDTNGKTTTVPVIRKRRTASKLSV